VYRAFSAETFPASFLSDAVFEVRDDPRLQDMRIPEEKMACQPVVNHIILSTRFNTAARM